MHKILTSAAVLATMLVPAAAQAQAIPAAVIAVVDLDRVTANCNACKTASATLRSQVTAYQNREKALASPLETEGKAIQTAINALNGKELDAALQNRVKAFQSKQQAGAQELQRQQQQIQRNQAYIQQQIAQKLAPIYQQVMQRRGATVLLEQGATLAASNSVDITNDVVTALNTALPTIQTTAPAQAQQQQPQGR